MLEPDETEQQTIAWIKEMREQGVTYRAVIDVLTNADVKMRSGNPFTLTLLHSILHSDRNA